MQLHYSHKLMQPEGHLGALFSIYECPITCVHTRARGIPRLNGPDYKQKSLIRTPHYKATCYRTTLPTQRPEGLSQGLKCCKHPTHNWVTCHVWNTLSPHTQIA